METCGFLSEKPKGRGPSAAAASGTTHTAEQEQQPQHCLSTETDTAPCDRQERSARSALAEHIATGVCMKTKKERYEASGLLEQVHQEDGRTWEDSCSRLAAPQLQQN